MSFSLKPKKTGKYLGLGIAAISAIFLFNPDVAIIDVLPDFIGYTLLAIALRFARDLSPHFENAWRKFRILAVMTFFKTLSLLWVFGGLTSAQERPTMMLLLSFCFCLCELIWGIPAWRSLIEGFILHSQTSGGEYPLIEKGAKSYRPGKNISYSFRDFTVFFMIAKAFFSNIAEFAVLSNHSYDDTAFDWYRFIGLYRAVAIFAGAVIGIIWLVRAIIYFRGILCDSVLISSMKEKYETTVLPNTGLFVRRDIAFVLGILAIAVLTTADLYLDDVNIISDTLTALLLAWTFIKMKPYYKNYKLGVILSAVYGVFTVVGSRLSYNFVTDSFPTKTWENTKVFREFITMYPVRVAEAALLFVTVFYALKGVRAIIDGHCGYIPSTMDEAYRKSRMEAIRKEVGAKVTVCLVIAAFAAVSGGLYEFILSLDLFISPIWWIINFVVCGAFFVSSLYMMNAVNEEVESRYMLD
ncbi:MAG: hypothetical protein J6S14_02475 [Clostridia bacterium]|nr:hypothetical protein [Clostridia bacterium]